MNINTNLPEVIHFSISVSHQTVVNKNTIPKKICTVNPANSIILFGKDMVNPTNAEIKRAAEMLIDNPEYALSQGLVNNLSI